MRADFVSQGMNHAEGGWPKVNIKSHGCIIDELRLIWVYTLYATFATFFYIWLILENPGPKTSKQEVRSYHLRISITINIINIIIYQYQYQSQDINPNENDQTMRFRKKIEKDERWVAAFAFQVISITFAA